MKKILTVVLSLACLVLLCACGAEAPAAAETTQPREVPALSGFSLSASTWSSPNGATVHLTATPSSYDADTQALFLVLLEGEAVAESPCTWDGSAYTASAELNAADGLCYYIRLTDGAGAAADIPLNTPAETTDEALVNLASALNSYCHATLAAASAADGVLTIHQGTVFVQAPRITNEGTPITVTSAVLALTQANAEIGRAELTLTESESDGAWEAAVTELAFPFPQSEDDQQLELSLLVSLSNGQSLNSLAGTFVITDGQLMTAVG